ncbi:signal peptidase I [Streptomyces sp. NPDC058613]|uniref:signal peptidase I n=1 Tax=Streptomyces sp. NPDC058613 TaxID=3346556 RepID=UPI0036580B05
METRDESAGHGPEGAGSARRPGRALGAWALALLLLGAALTGATAAATAWEQRQGYRLWEAYGAEMKPGYRHGELLLAEPTGGEGVERGDVVITSVPWYMNGDLLMQRVVALPGDRIAHRLGDDRLTLNGEPLDEPYLAEAGMPSTVAFDVSVPEGHMFLMADNRTKAWGSQFADNGPAPLAGVEGRVVAHAGTVAVALFSGWASGGALFLTGAGLGCAWLVGRRRRKRALAARTQARTTFLHVRPDAEPEAAGAGSAAGAGPGADAGPGGRAAQPDSRVTASPAGGRAGHRPGA